MKSQLKLVLVCFISFIWIQHCLCDNLSDASGANKWTCTCFSTYRGNQIVSNITQCASSCDCSPAAKDSKGNKWVCICDTDRLPNISSGDHDTICFTSCNCKSGSTSEAESSKKGESSKILVIILLLSVILTALVFVASFICYVYRREKCPIERSLSLSDKETSYNSASNLISHKAIPLPEFKVYISSPANSITGCIQKAALLFRNRTGMIQGTLTQFTYSELEYATNKFSSSNLIGLGGSSDVYWGHLKDGRKVAVKRMKAEGEMGVENDFMTEIELISRLHHCHVVPLLGFCSENQGKHRERLLVFEYMPRGNLRECLDGASGKFLDWRTRVSIALGAAKGLEYLHEAAAPRILHRDVKSTNILLEENWRAKITDLGMAKCLRNDGVPSCPNSPARMQGTFGYFAPEYAIVGRASLKSDVFSFGVVLLELITGRRPIQRSGGKEESLVIWATPLLLDSKRVSLELPDPNLEGNYPEEEMQVMAYLAKECLLLDPDSRPTMSEVVQILSTIASEKCSRRTFSFNHLQSSPTRHLINEPAIEMSDKRNQDVNETTELRCVASKRSPPRFPQPWNNEHTHFGKNMKEDKVLSEFVDKQIFQTSNTKEICSQYEQTLDITEPHFESFCVLNTSGS